MEPSVNVLNQQLEVVTAKTGLLPVSKGCLPEEHVIMLSSGRPMFILFVVRKPFKHMPQMRDRIQGWSNLVT